MQSRSCQQRIQQPLREDFANGLKCFQNDDFASALEFFRAADEGAVLGDALQGRYTSFHGLSLVCMGDSRGVRLCRKAAAGETRDAEVYYNLALAECRLNNSDRARMALRRGLRIDPEHAGLLAMNSRERPCEQHGAGLWPARKQLLQRLYAWLSQAPERS